MANSKGLRDENLSERGQTPSAPVFEVLIHFLDGGFDVAFYERLILSLEKNAIYFNLILGADSMVSIHVSNIVVCRVITSKSY